MCRYSGKEEGMKKIKILIGVLIIALMCGCSANAETIKYTGDEAVHFIDVGQGDSILVESNGQYMLVDAGEEDKGDIVVEYVRGLGIESLDYVVATHPHSDHIGGMDDVINSLNVENIIMPDMVTATRCFENMIDAVENNNVNVIKGEAGYSFSMGDFSCSIVGPVNIGDDANNNSVVMKLTYGNDSILLTGDCSKEEEQDIIESNADISADLLKAGHHGSSTSDSDEFVKRVSPEIAVISCGKDNEYGHPHKETLDTFNKYGVDVHRTDEEGTIIAECSGNGINLASSDGEYIAKADNTSEEITENTSEAVTNTYILNTSSKKFHREDCSSVKNMSDKNKEEYTGTAEELESMGYTPCGQCKPE